VSYVFITGVQEFRSSGVQEFRRKKGQKERGELGKQGKKTVTNYPLPIPSITSLEYASLGCKGDRDVIMRFLHKTDA